MRNIWLFADTSLARRGVGHNQEITVAHLTIASLEETLAKIGAGAFGKDVTYAYVETGKYKPYAEPTVRAAKARGYRVERRRDGVYFIYPKPTAQA